MNNEILRATTNYLLKAKSLNPLIESIQREHLTKVGGTRAADAKPPTVQFIYDQVKGEMPDLIDELAKRLEKEVGSFQD